LKHYSECPGCKSKNFPPVLKAKDHLVSGEIFQISECNECHLRFTNPIPDETEIGKYYQSQDYISHTNTSEGFINKIYQLVRSVTLLNKKNLIQKAAKLRAGKIMDIGCGTGEFLNMMHKAGWNVSGLEPDEGARRLANSNYQLQISPPDKLFELSENSFDVITMWHVLEHVHRLDDYMDQISKILKPDCTLFIAVPNYTSFDANHYNHDWAAYDVPRHLYHFSPQSMIKLLDRFHFKLEKMKRMPFDSFYVSMLSEKYKNGNIVKAFWVGLMSNWKALFNTEKCSSGIYIITKDNHYTN
jgi:SAM-dependent methyltransferase